MALCLLAGTLAISLGGDTITLRWTHSVERQIWEEDWLETPAGLVIAEARVSGSGAGMEMGPNAELRAGAWRWKPTMPPVPSITLRRSGATVDWQVCSKGGCRTLSDHLPPEADPVTLARCPG